jgi:hypothetical protein
MLLANDVHLISHTKQLQFTNIKLYKLVATLLASILVPHLNVYKILDQYLSKQQLKKLSRCSGEL